MVPHKGVTWIPIFAPGLLLLDLILQQDQGRVAEQMSWKILAHNLAPSSGTGLRQSLLHNLPQWCLFKYFLTRHWSQPTPPLQPNPREAREKRERKCAPVFQMRHLVAVEYRAFIKSINLVYLVSKNMSCYDAHGSWRHRNIHFCAFWELGWNI